ncbi:molybdopterin converting factor subunit 1 [Metabacillus herbersteinensis]|uniref:Molybdopterin synthase sulfur carrier subunit n=1 Tax=Metabacillus herbersteinensis TaxID=283816 RepID=A0ABV6GAM5_9BACI
MIKVLLFAHLQEEVGTESLSIERSNLTVKSLIQYLEKEYPFQSLQKVMVAINESYAKEDDLIQDGDVVAFIPPVSGG